MKNCLLPILRGMIAALLAAVIFTSCSDDDAETTHVSTAETVKIAVILPKQTNWERTLQWVKDNLALADATIQPEYEWYNEDSVDVESVADELSKRSDIACIVGCLDDANTQKVAYKCAKTYKPMFTFSASADLARAFGQRGFFWGLRESNITQCEVLLSKAALYGAKTVSLLAESGVYGQTFVDWFAFQATELGLTPMDIVTYSSKEEMMEGYNEIYENFPDYVICVPSGAEDVKTLTNEGHWMRILFSDKAFTSDVVGNVDNWLIEGVSPVADPSSGFNISYQAKFNVLPQSGEAELYDAVMIACMATAYMKQHDYTDLNEAIETLLTTEATAQGGWISGNMRETFQQIAAGATPAISGATGLLDFSTSNYTTIQYSTYTHWMLYDDVFSNLDYLSREGDGHSSSILAGWEWNKQKSQTFDENQTDITYSELTGHKAVIVAASSTWTNYRHQADALAFYHLLKTCGYTDDDIILIMADDLAYNEKNPWQGVVKRTLDGENLYTDVQIDYRLGDLTLNDLSIILSGTADDEHPIVLDSGSGDNVLFFWSGHGSLDGLVWNESRTPVTGTMLNNILTRLYNEKRFRKMFCITETCYSGGVAEQCEGIPGVLFLTAANGQETSKADILSEELGVWMTNRFTSVLLQYLTSNTSRTLRELYLETFTKTLGSHVMLYNVANYGNVYLNRTDEFFNVE